MGALKRPIDVDDERETEASTEVDVGGGDVDVNGGVPHVGTSGYESEGSTLANSFSRKRLAREAVSEGVVHTSQFPQCEFSNLQFLPITFNLDFFVGHTLISVKLDVLRALKMEGDFVRLLCFSV